MADENKFEQDIEWFINNCKIEGKPEQSLDQQERFAGLVANIWNENGNQELRARLSAFKIIFKK